MSALNYATLKFTCDLSFVQIRSFLAFFPALGNVLNNVHLNQQLAS